VLLPGPSDPEEEIGNEENAPSSGAPSTVAYPENLSADLYVFQEDSFWTRLDEASKLASNTASFCFVASMEGICDISTVETDPLVLDLLDIASECQLTEHAQLLADIPNDDILRESFERSLKAQNRASGQKPKQKAKAKNRTRKEVTVQEQRQFKKQFMEAKKKEFQSWVDNDVFELLGMRKHPPKNLSMADGF
jgi:hypothetical protein